MQIRGRTRRPAILQFSGGFSVVSRSGVVAQSDFPAGFPVRCSVFDQRVSSGMKILHSRIEVPRGEPPEIFGLALKFCIEIARLARPGQCGPRCVFSRFFLIKMFFPKRSPP
jgi:hypothetical protein